MVLGLMVQMFLAHGAALPVLAALAALAVVGIVAGAPDSGAAGDGDAGGAETRGDEGGAAEGNDAGDDGQGDAGREDLETRGEGDDDEDEDADLAPEIRDDPKRLRTRLRRTQRHYGAVRPIAERFRGPDGKYMSPQDIDRLIARARDMEELEPFLSQNPDITQTILQRRQTGGRNTTAADDEAFQDPFADPSRIAWDTENPSGKQFVDLFREGAKERHELRQQIKRLERQLGQVNERDTTRTVAGIEQTWKGHTLEAAKRLPDDATRTTFVNSVWRAFELARVRGQLGRIKPHELIQRELAPYLRAQKGKQRQDVAGRQQRAEHNTTIPRPGRGQPSAAGPKDTNRVGTIRDGRKSFFERIGMSAPPR